MLNITALMVMCVWSSVSELGEEGASGVRGSVLFHPPPNCRIREEIGRAHV